MRGQTIYPNIAVEVQGGTTPADDDIINSILKGTKAMMSSETILVDAVQDLVRDEIKRHIRQKIDSDPELKKELTDAEGDGTGTRKHVRAGSRQNARA
jgi:hypothetical protein